MRRTALILLSIILAVISVESREIYCPEGVDFKNGQMYHDSICENLLSLDYHLRVTIPAKLNNAKWNVDFIYSNCDTCHVTLQRNGKSTSDTDFGLPVSLNICDTDNHIKRYVINESVAAASDGWSFTVKKLPGDDSLLCSVGQKTPLFSFSLPSEGLRLINSQSMSGLKLNRLSIFSEKAAIGFCERFSSVEELIAYISNSKDSNERLWTYLDQDSDPRHISKGGDYQLATISNSHGSYDIVYLGGAKTNADYWHPLMIKGHLSKTIFVNHYDLTWIDAFGTEITDETNATITDGSILQLTFPLHSATIRFRRFTFAKDWDNR